MSLTVSAYMIGPDGMEHEIHLESSVAGFESARVAFYGSTAVQKLGLKLLPKLKDQSLLEVRGPELEALLAEVEVLIKTLPLNEFGESWAFRLNNIKVATEAVIKCQESGVVYIG